MPVNHSSIQDSYVEIKLKLIKLAVEASKSFTTFALLEEMIELQGQFCYSEAELQRYNNDILHLKCQLLYKKLLEHHSDLVDYDITEKKLLHIKQTMDDFQLIALQYTTSIQELIPDEEIKNTMTI